MQIGFKCNWILEKIGHQCISREHVTYYFAKETEDTQHLNKDGPGWAQFQSTMVLIWVLIKPFFWWVFMVWLCSKPMLLYCGGSAVITLWVFICRIHLNHLFSDQGNNHVEVHFILPEIFFYKNAPSNFCSSLKLILEALLFLVDSSLVILITHPLTHKEINSSRFYWHSEWSLKELPMFQLVLNRGAHCCSHFLLEWKATGTPISLKRFLTRRMWKARSNNGWFSKGSFHLRVQ